MTPIELRSRLPFETNSVFKYCFERHHLNYEAMTPENVDLFRAEDAVIKHITELVCSGDEGLADVLLSLLNDEGLAHLVVIVAEAFTSQVATGLNPKAYDFWTKGVPESSSSDQDQTEPSGKSQSL